MYHQNHFMIEILAKVRREQLLEYSMRSNLTKAIKPKRTRFLGRMLMKFGEMLIYWGTLIKNRYQPQFYTDSAAYRADSTNICVS